MTAIAGWIRTQVSLPPKGVEVQAKIDDANGCRNEGKLTFGKHGTNLWWSGDMYIYYKPTHWRPL